MMTNTRDTPGLHKGLVPQDEYLTQSRTRMLLLLMIAGSLAACDPVSLTVLGAGSSAGIQHSLSGVSYRTFTAPLSKVGSAAQTALALMGIKMDSREKVDNGELIKATAMGMNIEITLESLTSNMTRMRSIVRHGVLYDSATATEIVLQTEKALPGTN